MGMTLQEIKTELSYRKGQRDILQENITQLKKGMLQKRRLLLQTEKALEIAKKVGLLTQKQLEYHLSEQVSTAMEAVFDDPYHLQVRFQEKRDKTEVEFKFCRRDMVLTIEGGVGGGAIDVASLALRVAYLSMRQDKKVRPILILDEPFSQLKGEEANLRALAIIREICVNLGLQIIMISDERISRKDILENADRVFEVSQDRNGVSHVQIQRGEKLDG